MVRFPVDDVVAVFDGPPTVSLVELFPDALVVGGDPDARVLVPDGVHPLLGAVGRAFAEHRPLVLSPDAVWLTVAAGVAQHIRLHSERLRSPLVGHAGRKRLALSRVGPPPRDADSWRDIVELLGKLLAAEVAGAALFECDFSTSTEVDRVAGRVVLLDVYSPYFSYWARFICGIPSITLTGTVADWSRIRARVDDLAAFELDTWIQSLIPITDQFVRAASGDVDTAFWQRIYSPADAYGGDVVTGWAARLYPYLTGDGALDRPNPLLELPIDEPRDLPRDKTGYHGPGVRTDAVPATLSRVIVYVIDQVGADNRVVALHAGLVGIAQDDDGALRPVAGWHVAPAEIQVDDVLDRIVADHETTPPEPVRSISTSVELWFASADLLALYRRVGSASLFGGGWRLIPVANLRGAPRGPGRFKLVPIFELAGGRCLAAAQDHDRELLHWVVARFETAAPNPHGPSGRELLRLVDDPAEVPVYGSSLALLLDAALDSGGDIRHLCTGRLDDLDDTRDDTSVTERS
jgi:hypothetical protein